MPRLVLHYLNCITTEDDFGVDELLLQIFPDGASKPEIELRFELNNGEKRIFKNVEMDFVDFAKAKLSDEDPDGDDSLGRKNISDEIRSDQALTFSRYGAKYKLYFSVVEYDSSDNNPDEKLRSGFSDLFYHSSPRYDYEQRVFLTQLGAYNKTTGELSLLGVKGSFSTKSKSVPKIKNVLQISNVRVGLRHKWESIYSPNNRYVYAYDSRVRIFQSASIENDGSVTWGEPYTLPHPATDVMSFWTSPTMSFTFAYDRRTGVYRTYDEFGDVETGTIGGGFTRIRPTTLNKQWTIPAHYEENPDAPEAQPKFYPDIAEFQRAPTIHFFNHFTGAACLLSLDHRGRQIAFRSLTGYRAGFEVITENRYDGEFNLLASNYSTGELVRLRYDADRPGALKSEPILGTFGHKVSHIVELYLNSPPNQTQFFCYDMYSGSYSIINVGPIDPNDSSIGEKFERIFPSDD